MDLILVAVVVFIMMQEALNLSCMLQEKHPDQATDKYSSALGLLVILLQLSFQMFCGFITVSFLLLCPRLAILRVHAHGMVTIDLQCYEDDDVAQLDNVGDSFHAKTQLPHSAECHILLRSSRRGIVLISMQ